MIAYGGRPNVTEGYNSAEVRLYGLLILQSEPEKAEKLEKIVDAAQTIRTIVIITPELTKFLQDTTGFNDEVGWVAAIFGYAYEGSCYTLPKPRIMVIPKNRSSDKKPVVTGAVVKGDCGYDPNLGYCFWVLNKLDRCVGMDVQYDDIKTIVLDENTPGKRSPLTYAQQMALAPNQLNRDGG